jgi:hypothetical protein
MPGDQTHLDNLCLACRHHHRTFTTTGWQVQITNGRPEWRPPAWLDPQQKPRRNTVHHRHDFQFRQPTPAA